MKIKIRPIYSPDGKYARCGKCGMFIVKKIWKCKSCGTRIDWSMPADIHGIPDLRTIPEMPLKKWR
jgi:hypothetical protein